MVRLQIYYDPQRESVAIGLGSAGRAATGSVLTLAPPLCADEALALHRRLGSPTSLGWLRRMLGIERAYRIWLRLRGASCLAYPQWSEPMQTMQPDRRDDSLLQRTRSLVRRRCVTAVELGRRLQQEGYWPQEWYAVLEKLADENEVVFFPGATGPVGQAYCSRCGSREVVHQPCAACRRPSCPLCLTCENLGAMRGCTLLICGRSTKLAHIPAQTVGLRLPSLTPAQSQAAQALQTFLDEPAPQALVWAACGAGKTEVSLPLIQQALQRGMEVLFAIPRRDTVLELEPRLKESLPGVSPAVHCGGRPWYQEGRLVLATTHQLLRFRRRFDLAVLDEVDAFPYHGSEMLHSALLQALKPAGKLVEMTATPGPIRRGIKLVQIPARYHGMPLPVPRFCRIRLRGPTEWQQEDPLPDELMRPLSQSIWLVFVPTIQAAQAMGRCLRQKFGVEVDWSSSQDPGRGDKLAALKEGTIRILVATSIYERGITIPAVEVIVLYCDHPLYSSRALVQMAGRVGRTAAQPEGTVLFVGRSVTPAVRQAIKQIQGLNHQAEQAGLLTGTPGLAVRSADEQG